LKIICRGGGSIDLQQDHCQLKEVKADKGFQSEPRNESPFILRESVPARSDSGVLGLNQTSGIK